ncbi:MAG: protease modulator HflC [Lachnospiraceae bacterium]|nr:protease modulator HflC [Lachnospiraceae bacterium]
MKKKVAGVCIAIVLLALLGSSVVVTAENEYRLVRQFGRISRVIDTPGISFKIPFVQSTDTFPKQTLLYDLTPSDVITRDKKTMITDSYVLWRISDPMKFAQSLNGSVSNAETRINTAVYNAIKNAISSMNQEEVITSRDGELSEMVLDRIDDNMDEYGIELMMFETKQLDLPDDNKEAVYERMISERDNIAATYRAEGKSEAQVIQNTTDKEVAISISEAKKQAEILIAEGEAEYMRILSEAYDTEDKTEFYSFVRSLDALKASMSGGDKTVVLSEDSPIAQIFAGYGE